MNIPNAPKASFAQIAKNPQTWVMIVVLIMAQYLLTKFITSSDNHTEDWKQRLDQCEVKYERKSQDYDDLNRQLLLSNGILKEVTRASDSVQKQP